MTNKRKGHFVRVSRNHTMPDGVSIEIDGLPIPYEGYVNSYDETFGLSVAPISFTVKNYEKVMDKESTFGSLTKLDNLESGPLSSMVFLFVDGSENSKPQLIPFLPDYEYDLWGSEYEWSPVVKFFKSGSDRSLGGQSPAIFQLIPLGPEYKYEKSGESHICSMDYSSLIDYATVNAYFSSSWTQHNVDFLTHYLSITDASDLVYGV